MPVIGMDVSERPNSVLPTQSGLDLRIFADVNRIVVIDEAVPQGLAEDDPNQNNNYSANDEADPTRRNSQLNEIRFHDRAKEDAANKDHFPTQVWQRKSADLERGQGLLRRKPQQQHFQTDLLRRKPRPRFGEQTGWFDL